MQTAKERSESIDGRFKAFAGIVQSNKSTSERSVLFIMNTKSSMNTKSNCRSVSTHLNHTQLEERFDKHQLQGNKVNQSMAGKPIKANSTKFSISQIAQLFAGMCSIEHIQLKQLSISQLTLIDQLVC